MGFQALLSEKWALEKCANLFDRPVCLKVSELYEAVTFSKYHYPLKKYFKNHSSQGLLLYAYFSKKRYIIF